MDAWLFHLLLGSVGLAATALVAAAVFRIWRRHPVASYRLGVVVVLVSLSLPLAQLAIELGELSTAELLDRARSPSPPILPTAASELPQGSSELAPVELPAPDLPLLGVLLAASHSLREGPPMIERFARIVEDDLPDFCLPYCRKVTLVWCGFLLANAVCVGALAFFAPLEWWTLYAGLLFYLLMGALLAVEACVRKLWFRYYGDGWLDRLFAWLFPAERTANGRRSLAYVEQREALSRATS